VLRLPRGSPPLPGIAIELWLSPNTIEAHTQGHLPQLGVSTGTTPSPEDKEPASGEPCGGKLHEVRLG
jgi:hypothetical protein